MSTLTQKSIVAHQRIVREEQAKLPCLFIEEKQRLAASLENATVKEIDFDTAQCVIQLYEWLGKMGTPEHCFGLYFGPHLAGAICFGRTSGTKVVASVCGEEYASKVITLSRGACVHWAHPHSGSFFIARACKLMAEKGYNIFIAYSDLDAGEIGTIYQSLNWLYCGPTGASEKFRTPLGEEKDARLVHAYTRDRRGATDDEYRQKCTRAEMKERMIADGCKFFKGRPKLRYVGIYGDRRTKRELRKALRLPVLPYPKRGTK
jgi:hypothetical protein